MSNTTVRTKYFSFAYYVLQHLENGEYSTNKFNCGLEKDNYSMFEIQFSATQTGQSRCMKRKDKQSL